MKFKAALACTLLIIFSLYARTLFEARRQLHQGEQAVAAGQIDEGLRLLGEALAWSSPANRWALRADRLLSDIAFKETEGDKAGRLVALRELKRGLMSSRNFLNWYDGSARQQRIREIDGALARLHAADGPVVFRERHATTLAPRLQLLVQFCFWGWIGGVLYMIIRGFTPEGSYRAAPLRRGGIVFCIFYPLWMLSLWIA